MAGGLVPYTGIAGHRHDAQDIDNLPNAMAFVDSTTIDFTETPATVTADVKDNSITNTKLAQAPANTLKGNNTGSTANVQDLTVAQVQALLSIITQPTTTQATATANHNVTTTLAQIGSMTLTPDVTGTYQILFSSYCVTNTAGATISIGVYVNGVLVSGSQRTVVPTQTTALLTTVTYQMMISSSIQASVTSGQVVEVRAQVSAGTGTIGVRSLNINRIK